MLLSVEGLEKSGKTSVAYTSPIPVVGFSFDLGTKRAINGVKYEEYFQGLDIQIVDSGDYNKEAFNHDITVFEFPPPLQLNSNLITGQVELWDRFMTLLAKAITDAKVKTIVVDTMTLARRIKADAILQEMQEKTREGGTPRKQLLQIEWGGPNDAIRSIYNICQGMGKNLVAVHHLTDEYKEIIIDGKKESSPTGKSVLEGYSKTYQAVDVGVRMQKVKGKMSGSIEVCGYNPSLEGMVLEDITWNKLVDTIEMSLGGRLGLPKR